MDSLAENLKNIRDAGDKIGRIWTDENGVLFQDLFREQVRVLEEIILQKTDENG